MTADPRTLRAAYLEAEARCNTARLIAEQAQTSQHWPGTPGPRVTDAERALEAFLTAVEVRDRAKRAWEQAMGKGAA